MGWLPAVMIIITFLSIITHQSPHPLHNICNCQSCSVTPVQIERHRMSSHFFVTDSPLLLQLHQELKKVVPRSTLLPSLHGLFNEVLKELSFRIPDDLELVELLQQRCKSSPREKLRHSAELSDEILTHVQNYRVTIVQCIGRDSEDDIGYNLRSISECEL